MSGKWIKTSLFFLVLIAFLGTGMRAIPFLRLPLVYDHIMHAHSHVAFQGWIYTAMMLFLTKLFLTQSQIEAGRFALQFKATSLVIVGVLISFALQGYGLYSIIFSTLFQLLNYWFIFSLFREFRGQQQAVSLLFVKSGLWLGLLSTLAPWAIGVLSAKGLGESEAYRSAVYFFLHFQYNGWFQFVALGLFFKWLETEAVQFDLKKARMFYVLFAVSVIPAYALSLLGMSFSNYVIAPAAMAAILQLVGLWLFFQALKIGSAAWFSLRSPWQQWFLLTAMASLGLKYVLQFLSVFPVYQEFAFASRNIIMAYMHLCLLGVLTCFFIALMLHLKWLDESGFTKFGSTFFLLGFFATEMLLALSGMGWVHLPELLLLFSAVMAAGLLLLLVGSLRIGK